MYHMLPYPHAAIYFIAILFISGARRRVGARGAAALYNVVRGVKGKASWGKLSTSIWSLGLGVCNVYLACFGIYFGIRGLGLGAWSNECLAAEPRVNIFNSKLPTVPWYSGMYGSLLYWWQGFMEAILGLG